MEEDDDDHPTTADVISADFENTGTEMPLGPGTEVHGYVIDGDLGKGGMGFVYSATHPLIGKRAAIKVLKPEVSTSPIIVERFIQEARAVNQIHHPNIIDIFAFGTLPDGRAYHVMDLLVGETLRKRLKRGPLHPSEAASVLDDTASALIAAHGEGFVHRDLKPDNIFLVEREGEWPDVRLLDFGLAKLMPEAGIAPFTTKTGVMLGTPEYMSPEQARGLGVDYRTDVYALGVVTFEILAGQRPFPSMGDAFATLQAHAEEPPPSLRDMVPDLPAEMIQLVDAMLAKEPGARPSLAAVRTVIKRLRTTQLPTRTAAGLEISSFQGLSKPPRPEITASRFGADPVVATPDAAQRAAALHAEVPPMMRSASRPPLSQPPENVPSGSQPDPPRLPEPPRRSVPPLAEAVDARRASSPQFVSHGTNPGLPAKSTHGSGRGTPSVPPIQTSRGSDPDTPPATMSPRSASVPPLAQSSTAGLAKPLQNLAGTTLGVPPPVKVSVKPGAPVEKRSNRVWLVLGALIAIAAGIVLALVLVGD